MSQEEDEVDNGSCLATFALLIVGLVPLLTIAALTYFTVETVAGRMDYCTLWTDVPGRLTILAISYYVAGLCGYLPIPECCFVNCLPQPLLLWRRSTWGNFFRNCLPTPTTYNRFHESPQVASSTSPHSLPGTREESFRDSSAPIFQRRRSEPRRINVPQRPSSEVIVHLRPDQPLPTALDQRRRSEPFVGSQEELFNSAGSSPRGCIVPMVIGRNKPPYLPSSLEASTEQMSNPFQHRQDSDTPSRTDISGTSLPDYPRCPWIYLRDPGGRLPVAAFKAHKKNLKIEKHLIEKQDRLQREKDQHAVRKTESSEEKVAEGGLDADQRLLQLQSQRHRRSRSKAQSRRRSESTSSSKSLKRHKSEHPAKPSQAGRLEARQEDITECGEPSPNLKAKVDRIKKMLEKNRDSEAVKERQGVSSRLEVENPREVDARTHGPGLPGTSKSGEAVTSSLKAKATEVLYELSRERVGVRTHDPIASGTSQSEQAISSRLKGKATEVLDETTRERVGVRTHVSGVQGTSESEQAVSMGLQLEVTEVLDETSKERAVVRTQDPGTSESRQASGLQTEITEVLDDVARKTEVSTTSNREPEEQRDKIFVRSRKDKADK